MIIGFFGTVGSGKTLSAVHEAYGYHKRGFTVYSNIHLSFPHIKLTRIVFESLMRGEELNDAIVLLDEIHIWLDSRSSMTKKNKIATYFILQTRKRNVRLLYTSQHTHQVEKRLRDTTDIFVLCENMTNQTALVNDKKDVLILQRMMYQWRPEQKERLRTLRGGPLFGLYDTREIVDFSE